MQYLGVHLVSTIPGEDTTLPVNEVPISHHRVTRIRQDMPAIHPGIIMTIPIEVMLTVNRVTVRKTKIGKVVDGAETRRSGDCMSPAAPNMSPHLFDRKALLITDKDFPLGLA